MVTVFSFAAYQIANLSLLILLKYSIEAKIVIFWEVPALEAKITEATAKRSNIWSTNRAIVVRQFTVKYTNGVTLRHTDKVQKKATNLKQICLFTAYCLEKT